MLTTMTFTKSDLDGIPAIDEHFRRHDLEDPWIQSFFVHAFRDLFDDLRAAAPAVAVPYNCGTLIAAPNGKLVGIDLTLLENYYDGRRWNIPGWLYDLITERLDLLIVSHGHWDHCWVELIWSLIQKGKTVIVPEGIRPCLPKVLPHGCIGVRDGTRFWWEGLHLSFHMNAHVYGTGHSLPVLATRIWDGKHAFLHTSDADTTDANRFRWHNAFPTDVLLFKFGGVSPIVNDYDALVRTVDLIKPRRMLLPIHLSEFGHRGTAAAHAYAHAYDTLERYRSEGRLGDRRYSVLFGNRVVRL